MYVLCKKSNMLFMTHSQTVNYPQDSEKQLEALGQVSQEIDGKMQAGGDRERHLKK